MRGACCIKIEYAFRLTKPNRDLTIINFILEYLSRYVKRVSTQAGVGQIYRGPGLVDSRITSTNHIITWTKQEKIC